MWRLLYDTAGATVVDLQDSCPKFRSYRKRVDRVRMPDSGRRFVYIPNLLAIHISARPLTDGRFSHGPSDHPELDIDRNPLQMLNEVAKSKLAVAGPGLLRPGRSGPIIDNNRRHYAHMRVRRRPRACTWLWAEDRERAHTSWVEDRTSEAGMAVARSSWPASLEEPEYLP
jgi:hypothetical protein